MKSSISLGRWLGVPVGLHYSWFILAWLIALSLTGQFAALNRNWPAAVLWSLALVTAALFFVCIVLHELAHSIVARLSGVPVRGITLFALGGVSQIEKEAATPGKEFWIAIAGPVASIVIGIICRAAAAAAGLGTSPASPSAVSAVLAWLAYINIALGVFNLIPGFPLDGGRVLRAIIWAVNHNGDRATRIAARVGQIVAFIFIVGGLFSLILRADFGGLWIAIIGWFLLESAQAYLVMSQVAASLRGVRVADVMARDCATVDPAMPLRQFVNEQLLHLGARCFAVSQDGQLQGLVTPADVKRVPRERWDEAHVVDVMRPLQSLHPLTPDAPAGEALELMGRENVNQIPVVSQGHLAGVVTRSYLLHLLQVRRELHA